MKKKYLILIIIGVILISGGILIFKNFTAENQVAKINQEKNQTTLENEKPIKEELSQAEQKQIEKITLPQTKTLDEAKTIIENWIKSQPTYKFDGQNLDVKETKEIANNFYRFLYNFETSHPGFGDRSKQKPEEKVTPHLIEITAQNNRVLYALIDGRWDELEQKLAY
ncbi:MAG: hypothetical protein V1892_00440 [bacterium]